MSAGVASAEVSISGYAEMGIVGGDAVGDTQFHQDIEVTFGMSLETSNGLTFGASIDLDETDVPDHGDLTGTTVYMSGAFGTLTMGDTDGALDWAMTETGMGTSMNDDHTSHAGYSGNSSLDGQDGQVLRYEYAFGKVGVAASAILDDAGNDDIFGLGATYDADVVKLGLGYQDDGTDAALGLSVSGEASGVQYVANYSDLDSDGTHMGLGLGYTTGALMLHANYGVFETNAGVKTDGFGLAANYDLGGGAVVMAGYGSDMDGSVAGNQNSYSLGVGLSF